MIRRFRHRGLKRLYERDDRSGVNAEHVARLERILTLLDVAQRPADIDLPGYRLHSSRGAGRANGRFRCPAIGA